MRGAPLAQQRVWRLPLRRIAVPLRRRPPLAHTRRARHQITRNQTEARVDRKQGAQGARGQAQGAGGTTFAAASSSGGWWQTAQQPLLPGSRARKSSGLQQIGSVVHWAHLRQRAGPGALAVKLGGTRQRPHQACVRRERCGQGRGSHDGGHARRQCRLGRHATAASWEAQHPPRRSTCLIDDGWLRVRCMGVGRAAAWSGRRGLVQCRSAQRPARRCPHRHRRRRHPAGRAGLQGAATPPAPTDSVAHERAPVSATRQPYS